MNAVIAAMLERRSIRSYQERQIAPEELNEKMRADALALMEYIKNMEDTQ